MTRTYLGGRVLAARRTAWMALGDLAALVAFGTASAARHGGGAGSVFQTVGQFGVGWLVAAVLVGAYGPGALERPRRAALLGAGAWALGAPIGGLVRLATEPGAGLTPVFLVVTAGVGAGLFGGWRWVAARTMQEGSGVGRGR